MTREASPGRGQSRRLGRRLLAGTQEIQVLRRQIEHAPRTRIVLARVGCAEQCVVLPRSGGDADFSPDSRLLAYEGVANKGSSNPTIGHLVVLNLHTHRAVLVSPRWLGDILGHSWSPDGKTLIFAARPNEACSSLYTVTLRAPHWKLFRSC